MKKLTRRTFLASLALFPATIFAKSGSRQQQAESHAPGTSQQWQQVLEIVIGPHPSIVIVGNACRQDPLQLKYSDWSRGFFDKLDKAIKSPGKWDLRTLRDSYQQRVKSDFQKGRTTGINGYVLSKTEVDIFHWVASAKHDKKSIT